MLLVAPSSPEKRAAHQRHMRQTPEALSVGLDHHTQPPHIQAFNCEPSSSCWARDPDSHSVLAFEGVTVQKRSSKWQL